MKKFNEFTQFQKNFISGKISQFTDVYLRKNKVWTPNQILSDFVDKIQQNITENYYVTEEKYRKYLTDKNIIDEQLTLEAIHWLLTENGNVHSLNKFSEKYNKHIKIADERSPLIQRVRFGLKWENNLFFDVNFGLKSGYEHIAIEELENILYKPWTIEHVNNQLLQNYNTNLLDCLESLSTSYLERKFVNYWKRKFYFPENSALIPEVCGLRKKFYYYKYADKIYSSKSEILSPITSQIEEINFRYDFLIANFKKQKIAFIELDGFEYHKSNERQIIDSIKRNTATKLNIPIFTFTSNKVNENIDAIFQDIESYLE